MLIIVNVVTFSYAFLQKQIFKTTKTDVKYLYSGYF